MTCYRSLTTALLLSTALTATAAHAQSGASEPTDAATASTSEDGGNDADIIVTAQKIEQRAVDVPITISVNTGNRLRELGVSDLDELSNFVPGLNIQ